MIHDVMSYSSLGKSVLHVTVERSLSFIVFIHRLSKVCLMYVCVYVTTWVPEFRHTCAITTKTAEKLSTLR